MIRAIHRLAPTRERIRLLGYFEQDIRDVEQSDGDAVHPRREPQVGVHSQRRDGNVRAVDVRDQIEQHQKRNQFQIQPRDRAGAQRVGVKRGGVRTPVYTVTPLLDQNCNGSIADEVTSKWVLVLQSNERRTQMAVAKVSEISATSAKSFEDAIQQGLTRAAKTLRNISGAWVKEHQVRCDGARITEYQVNMMVTFVLDD